MQNSAIARPMQHALDSQTAHPASASEATLTPRAKALVWVLQVVAAGILGQTLFFKFTGAPEAVALFTKLGVEPWGRIATGVLELATVALLLVPRLAALGGLAAAGSMAGAIFLHLTVLGIEVEGDGGTLFALAIVTLLAGAGVAWIRRTSLPVVGQRFGSDA